MALVASQNFLVPNLTFVFELIAFLIVLAVVAKYVLPPLQKALNDRQETIRQGILDSEDAKRRLAQTEADYREAMERARSEARAMVDEANRIGEQMRLEARRRGEQEAERIVAAARSEIDASARRAAAELRAEVTSLVVSVVQRVVGEALDAEAHRALIDRTIAEVESGTSGATQAVSAP
jgi:F-type H+-transporting ATPase subunit b